MLVNYDTAKLKFTVAPASFAPIHCFYRYNVRPDVTVADAAGITAMGGTIWAPTLRDDSIQRHGARSGGRIGVLIAIWHNALPDARNDDPQRTAGGTIVPWEPGANVVVDVDAFALPSKEMTIRGVTMRSTDERAERAMGIAWCIGILTWAGVSRWGRPWRIRSATWT